MYADQNCKGKRGGGEEEGQNHTRLTRLKCTCVDNSWVQCLSDKESADSYVCLSVRLSHLCAHQPLPQPRDVCHSHINVFGKVDVSQVIVEDVSYPVCQVIVAVTGRAHRVWFLLQMTNEDGLRTMV